MAFRRGVGHTVSHDFSPKVTFGMESNAMVTTSRSHLRIALGSPRKLWDAVSVSGRRPIRVEIRSAPFTGRNTRGLSFAEGDVRGDSKSRLAKGAEVSGHVGTPIFLPDRDAQLLA